jgi:hypothetical protein
MSPSTNENMSPTISITQDPVLLKPTLKISSQKTSDKLIFTINCNYFLFIKRSELTLYDQNKSRLKTITLPNPIPRTYEIPLTDLPTNQTLYYQLSVYDKDGHEDRTSLSEISI